MQPYSQYLTCRNTTISEPWVEEPNIFSLISFQFSSLAIQIKASQFLSHLINIWIQGEVNESIKVSWICASVACIWSSQLLTYLGFSQDHVFDRLVLQSLMHLLHLRYVLISFCAQPGHLWLVRHLQGSCLPAVFRFLLSVCLHLFVLISEKRWYFGKGWGEPQKTMRWNLNKSFHETSAISVCIS